jgi:amino acid transporter
LGATASQPSARLDADGLERGLGFFGLLWASETSIIGSGWLFGALGAGIIAGPSAIFGWVLASIIVAILALIHAELGGLFPVTGGTSRFPHYAFGSFAGATFGWASYLQAASVAPIEVLAAIQYLSTAHWAHSWYTKQSTGPGTLSGVGIVAAIVLMILFVIFNLIGIRWLARISNIITTWKIFIPILTIIILIVGHFHSGNFGHAAGGFFVHPGPIKAIIETLPAGIVFSLLGFEQAVQLAGEAKDPQKDLAKAVIGSVIIGAAVYLLLQVAFIGAMDPHLLAANGGWTSLGAPAKGVGAGVVKQITNLNAGPFYTVASLAGIGWLATVLRVDAVISPSGTGLVYTTSASRLSFGMAKNGFLPSAFESIEPRSKAPIFSVIIAAVVGLLFLLPFPSWSELVNVVTAASVLMYAAAPLSLAALRLQKPNLPRPYRVANAQVMAPLGFVGASLIIVFSGWETYTTLMVAVLLGYLLIWLSYTFKLNPKAPSMDWQGAPWIAGYFIGMLIISYVGDFGPGGIIGGIGIFKHWLDTGGTDKIHGLAWTLLLTVAWSLVVYYWALHSRLPESKVDEYVEEVYPAADAIASH